MAQGVCELLWLKIILEDLKIKLDGLMRLYCGNKSAISIAHNPMQHDQMKHIEIDKHFIKEKLDNGLICTPYASINHQLVDILTKGLSSTKFQANTSKLGMENIYSPAWWKVWKIEIRKDVILNKELGNPVIKGILL